MAHLPRVFRSAVHHQGSFLKFDPTYSSRLGDASGTITNIVFGLLAVFVGVLTVWQAHRAYTLWHTHRSQQLPPACKLPLAILHICRAPADRLL